MGSRGRNKAGGIQSMSMMRNSINGNLSHTQGSSRLIILWFYHYIFLIHQTIKSNKKNLFYLDRNGVCGLFVCVLDISDFILENKTIIFPVELYISTFKMHKVYLQTKAKRIIQCRSDIYGICTHTGIL